MCARFAFVGRSADRPGVEERRVGDDATRRDSASPASRRSLELSASSRKTRVRASSPLRAALLSASCASSGSISTRSTEASGLRSASARPTAPTPAPTSTIRPCRASPAAATSRAASVPTRWPRLGWMSMSRPPSHRSSVSPSAVAALSGSAMAQPSSSSFPRPASTMRRRARASSSPVDQNPPWQEAERALRGGHVLVGDEIGDPLRLQDRFDDGDENEIVGAQDFDQNGPRLGLTCRVGGPSLWSRRGIWQGNALRGNCRSTGRQIGRSPDRAVDDARRGRHGQGQSDHRVAHRIRGHDDPRGRQSPHRLRRQADASDPDFGDGRPLRLRGEGHIKLAAAVEFMHTATLLHDDVVDESDLRRGKAAARVLWGNEASVLVGDFLLGQAFKMMVEVGSLPCLEVLSGAAVVIAEGEVMQLSAAKDTETTEDAYLAVIRSKTAALFAAACEVGPILAGRSKAEIAACGVTAPIWASPFSSSTMRSTTAARRPSSARMSATISARERSPCRSSCRSGAGARKSANSGAGRWKKARSSTAISSSRWRR